MAASSKTGTVNQSSPRGLLRWFLRTPIFLYRLKLGWVLGKRFLLLTHTGRKSKKEHATVLEVLHYDPASHHCLIASGWGAGSQWYQNIRNEPSVKYMIGSRQYAGKAEQLTIEQAKQALQDYANRHPTAIRQLTKVMIGEKFDGSSTQHQQLATQVPILQLTPDQNGDDNI